MLRSAIGRNLGRERTSAVLEDTIAALSKATPLHSFFASSSAAQATSGPFAHCEHYEIL